MKKYALTFEHKDLLLDALFDIQIDISEYSFSNLFLFREKHQYEIIEGSEGLYIGGVTYDGITYVMPTKDILEAGKGYLNELLGLLDHYQMIFPVPESWLSLFPESAYNRIYTTDDTDYIFTAEKLMKFPGRKLHGKRNLLSQFLSHYEGGIKKIDADNVHEAIEILEIWQNESGSSKEETDYVPCLEAIQHFREMKLCGALFTADGKSVGFMIGEEINKSMYGIHFAKGIKQIKGIYQYMFSKSSEIHSERYGLINLEQDMGKASLRAAKSSYIPDRLAHKYRISKK